MRIDEMQERTAALRLEIKGLVAAFEIDTRCQVESLEIKRRGIVIGSDRAPAIHEHPDDLVDVAITVRLHGGGPGWITGGRDERNN